jgi:hypothetical protein
LKASLRSEATSDISVTDPLQFAFR